LFSIEQSILSTKNIIMWNELQVLFEVQECELDTKEKLIWHLHV